LNPTTSRQVVALCDDALGQLRLVEQRLRLARAQAMAGLPLAEPSVAELRQRALGRQK
jgi:hypothetical protein